MAKRVTAQRQGLLYGLIAVIVAVVVLGVLLFVQYNRNQNTALQFDPQIESYEQLENNLRNTMSSLQDAGLMPAERTSLTAAIDYMRKRLGNYEQGIGNLTYVMNRARPDVEGDNLTAVVKVQQQAGEAAVARAMETFDRPGREGIPIPANLRERFGENASLKEVVGQVSMVEAIDALIGQTQSLVGRINDQAIRISDLEATNDTLQSATESAKQTAQTNLQEMTAEKDQRIASLQSDLEAAQEQVETLVNEKDALREDTNKADAEFKDQIQELKNTINQQDSRIEELAAELERQRTRLVEPDGQIVNLRPGEDTGFINLAQGDAVFPNLTFAVYDDKEMGKETPTPKGSLRVKNVMSETSEVVITSHDTANPVVEGDLIANPIYDPKLGFQFAVVGYFDVDGDGDDDASMIKSMIRRFGGQVQEQVTVQTDFLVVGDDPLSRFQMGPGGLTPQQQADYDRVRKEQEAYGRASDMAARLYIPVLNMNRFLAMAGVKAPVTREDATAVLPGQ